MSEKEREYTFTAREVVYRTVRVMAKSVKEAKEKIMLGDGDWDDPQPESYISSLKREENSP